MIVRSFDALITKITVVLVFLAFSSVLLWLEENWAWVEMAILTFVGLVFLVIAIGEALKWLDVRKPDPWMPDGSLSVHDQAKLIHRRIRLKPKLHKYNWSLDPQRLCWQWRNYQEKGQCPAKLSTLHKRKPKITSNE